MSKASEWAKLAEERGLVFRDTNNNVVARVNDEGQLSAMYACLSPADAVRFARWLDATFGDGA